MSASEKQQSGGSGEERVFLEKRPTCVTVIGWVWIILGALSCLGALWLVFVWFVEWSELGASFHERALEAALYVLLLVMETTLGVLSLSGGMNFLKLKSRARKLLLVLCWIMLILFVANGVLFLCVGIWDLLQGEPMLPTVGGLVLGVLWVGALCAGFVIMLRYLRGDRVKDAMRSAGEPAGGGESRMDSDAHSSAAHD